tara:strand:- start:9455 stop:9781 length:327 start_codon:yes stop_codon:yes gene_type:complete
MGRKVDVFMFNKLAGSIEEEVDKYVFTYADGYKGKPLSLSLPLSKKIHESEGLHPYFKSLAPEGWLKKRYSEIQKIDERDTFGFLIENGDDLLGAITVKNVTKAGQKQ